MAVIKGLLECSHGGTIGAAAASAPVCKSSGLLESTNCCTRQDHTRHKHIESHEGQVNRHNPPCSTTCKHAAFYVCCIPAAALVDAKAESRYVARGKSWEEEKSRSGTSTSELRSASKSSKMAGSVAYATSMSCKHEHYCSS